jgi:prephenate dehydrogenase
MARAKPTPTKDIIPIFEAQCIDMGSVTSRALRMTRREADVTVERMLDTFGETLQELADLIEAEDWDAIYALAKQEQTRKMIRGVV